MNELNEALELKEASQEKKREFLTNIVTGERLENMRPGYFNILAAPRGAGKSTWAVSEEVISFAARDKKNVIYLIHTRNARDAICAEYPDVTRVFTDKDADGWFKHRHKSMWTLEEDVNKIRVMCYQTFSSLICRDIEWLEDIDLIVWDEFDDIEQYYDKEVKDLKKRLPGASDEKLAAMLRKDNIRSVCAFIYNIQTIILEPARIRLVAMSATPELAAPLFGKYVNYIIYGELDEYYDAKHVIYIESVAAALRAGIITPQKNMCPWVFTSRITDIIRFLELFRAMGFNPLPIWSYDNPKWRLYVTDKMKADAAYVNNTHYVPQEYDCVITNQAAGRAVNILDERFQDWICDSRNYSDIGQFIRARYSPERKYILKEARGLVEFIRADTKFSAEYYVWHSRDEIKQLLESSPIYDKQYKRQLTTWNAVKKEWEDTVIFESRRYGAKHLMQYRIVDKSKEGKEEN